MKTKSSPRSAPRAKPQRKARTKCHARLQHAGVNIYAGGQMMCGITEREAKELQRSLSRLLPKLKRTIKKYDL